MPLVVGYALLEDVESLRESYETFILDDNESRGLGISKNNPEDILIASFIPMSVYDTMDTDKWENCYIIDERNKEEQLKLGL